MVLIGSATKPLMLQRFSCRAFARRLIPENRRYQQHQYEPSFRNPKGFGDTVGNTSLRDNTRVSSADFMPASERVTATINAKIQKFKKWEAIVMSFKEEFAEAQRRFGLLGFYDKFEYVVILLLTALIAVFIVFALWNVALKIFLSIAASSFDPTDYVVSATQRGAGPHRAPDRAARHRAQTFDP